MAEATSSYTPTANVILLSVNRIRCCASGSVCEAACLVWTNGLPQLRQASALSPGASLKAIVADGQRSSLSVLLFCAPVFIFTSGSSALISAHVVVYLTCHINMPICFTRKRTKHKNTRSPPFSYDTEMAANGYKMITRVRVHVFCKPVDIYTKPVNSVFRALSFLVTQARDIQWFAKQHGHAHE